MAAQIKIGSSVRLSRLCCAQVWLQEFAWSEKQKPYVLEQRNNSMAAEDQERIASEPVFSFEHCCVCLYWSFLVYDYKEVPRHILSPDSSVWSARSEPPQSSYYGCCSC